MPARRGVVVGHFGIAVDVETIDDVTGAPKRESVRVARKSGFVVGDDVDLDNAGRLSLRPRKNALRRRSPGGGVHIVAVNLDVLGVVVAVEPEPKAGLVDRAIVAARAAGIRPFVVVNKVDIDDEVARDFIAALGGELMVLPLSARSGQGVEALEAVLRAQGRGVLVGPSGVGKSSLVNRLVPGAGLKTGALSVAHGTGKHTTSASKLFRLPGGGELVDTPGVREYGLVDVDPHEVATHFVGFDAVAGTCRFRDCLHEDEPGCAVTDAVEADRVAPERYVAYRRLLDELREDAKDSTPW